jgi:hypothetical protein
VIRDTYDVRRIALNYVYSGSNYTSDTFSHKPAVLVAKLSAGVVDTGGKFVNGVVDTGSATLLANVSENF